MKLVAAAIIVSDGKVLLARRRRGDSHQGYWEFPGGVVEAGETTEECLARELREELGVEATAGEVVASAPMPVGSAARWISSRCARRRDGEFTLTAHDAVEWVRPRDLRATGSPRRTFRSRARSRKGRTCSE